MIWSPVSLFLVSNHLNDSEPRVSVLGKQSSLFLLFVAKALSLLPPLQCLESGFPVPA